MPPETPGRDRPRAGWSDARRVGRATRRRRAGARYGAPRDRPTAPWSSWDRLRHQVIVKPRLGPARVELERRHVPEPGEDVIARPEPRRERPRLADHSIAHADAVTLGEELGVLLEASLLAPGLRADGVPPPVGLCHLAGART